MMALSVVACQEDRQASTGLSSETTDSAGIRIVENPRPPEGSRLPWRIGPEPTVSIGTREGEEAYQLYIVRDAMMLPDGRIIVANGGSGELRIFDALGTHLASWGGEGEGPGEFDNLWQIEPWTGDSIAAWFAPRMGISVFDAEGNYARTFTLAAAPGTPPWLQSWPFASTSDGFILAVRTPDTVVVQLRAVTRAHIDAHVEEILSPPYPDDWTESEIEGYLAEERQRYRAAPVVENFPAFASVMSDALDHLWVEEYEVPGEERPGVLWTVFDPEGKVLGFVETPEGLEILEIGEDNILGHYRDELGVEYVQVWPLERSVG